MCLEYIHEEYEHPSAVILDAWKEFGGSESKPQVQYPVNGSNVIPFDQWVKAEGSRINMGPSKDYPAGFHCYEDESTKSYNPGRRRVFIRRIHTRGRQHGEVVLVASEMYVPKDQKNGWPPTGNEPPEPPKESLGDRIKKATGLKGGSA